VRCKIAYRHGDILTSAVFGDMPSCGECLPEPLNLPCLWLSEFAILFGMKYLKKLKVEFVKGEFKNPIKGQIRDPAQIFSVFKDIKDWTKETLIGVYLNDKVEINSYEIHSVGGESFTFVLPDEIFRSAILTNSRSLSSSTTIRQGRTPRPTRTGRQCGFS
jgi:RadC-like JAB domain-containing protein